MSPPSILRTVRRSCNSARCQDGRLSGNCIVTSGPVVTSHNPGVTSSISARKRSVFFRKMALHTPVRHAVAFHENEKKEGHRPNARLTNMIRQTYRGASAAEFIKDQQAWRDIRQQRSSLLTNVIVTSCHGRGQWPDVTITLKE